MRRQKVDDVPRQFFEIAVRFQIEEELDAGVQAEYSTKGANCDYLLAKKSPARKNE